jgi:hypothetical protein
MPGAGGLEYHSGPIRSRIHYEEAEMSISIFIMTAAFMTADTVKPAVEDVLRPVVPGRVQIGGWVGERILRCEKNRLLVIDEERLLRGFRQKPGEQAWIGEHVGKWLHAASLAWLYTKDPALREKLDRVAKGLLATQEPDGYLGTYVPGKRFGLFPEADWDVWVHKYCILGLLAYHEATGDAAALAGARRAADLLTATFGPGKKSIIDAGTHMGMAATSVLEPIVLLHRETGEPRYLEFARYIVSAYDEPKGPGIIRSLLDHGDVRRTANAKAYEMMSNLVGLCELYRTTGEKRLLEVCERAWRDIAENHMYITEGVSLGEHFQDDGVLPNRGAVSETCAQVTWLQLNLQLLRLTGNTNLYAVALEKLVLNHLLASQKPDGSGFCYFTPLEGKKPFGTDINCCTSSGSRGLMLIPTFAAMRIGSADHIVLPRVLSPEKGWELAAISGDNRSNTGRVAVMRGPMVYAFEPRFNPDLPPLVALDGKTLESLQLEAVPAPADRAYDPGQVLVKARGIVLKAGKGRKAGEAVDMYLGDFARAGGDGGAIRVWLPVASSYDISKLSLFAFGKEGWSREGNQPGSISDEDPTTFRVTFDGKPAAEDWFSVENEEPVETSRVVFVQGRLFHDGGWFDASNGKPRIEVRRAKGGPWEAAAVLEDYPAATATDPRDLREGWRFEVKLPQPVKALAIRVIGKPASGDNPAQSFASCAELAAH